MYAIVSFKGKGRDVQRVSKRHHCQKKKCKDRFSKEIFCYQNNNRKYYRCGKCVLTTSVLAKNYDQFFIKGYEYTWGMFSKEVDVSKHKIGTHIYYQIEWNISPPRFSVIDYYKRIDFHCRSCGTTCFNRIYYDVGPGFYCFRCFWLLTEVKKFPVYEVIHFCSRILRFTVILQINWLDFL